jgi:hypothetical protein
VAPWRINNPYCKLMRSNIKKRNFEIFKLLLTKPNLTKEDVFLGIFGFEYKQGIHTKHGGDKTRYSALNLKNLVQRIVNKQVVNGLGTIEVRLRQGTCDTEEIMNWVNLLEKFFASCLSTNFDNFIVKFEQNIDDYLVRTRQRFPLFFKQYKYKEEDNYELLLDDFYNIFIQDDTLKNYWEKYYNVVNYEVQVVKSSKINPKKSSNSKTKSSNSKTKSSNSKTKSSNSKTKKTIQI